MKQIETDWWRFNAARSSSGAFTSIELLVVITVLVVFAAIMFPALARSKDKDIRVVCVNNEKQLYASLQMYCDDNRDGLPPAVNWPWDMPTSATTPMTNSGCIQKTFYCPSTAPRFTDQQNWAETNSLWNYGPNSGSPFNITGYSFAIGGPYSKLAPLYQNQTILSELHTNGITVSPDSPGTRELLADVILSTRDFLPATAADNFYVITGGFTQNGASYPHLSAHLGVGLVPTGGNIAYKDGHVQWRKFDASSAMERNNSTKARTTSDPWFWW